jgi:hypothetical protein
MPRTLGAPWILRSKHPKRAVKPFNHLVDAAISLLQPFVRRTSIKSVLVKFWMPRMLWDLRRSAFQGATMLCDRTFKPVNN